MRVALIRLRGKPVHATIRHRPARRRRQAVAAGGSLILSVTVLSVGVSPAAAADLAASDDTTLTGSGIPVTVDVLANDLVAGEVSAVRLGTVTGGDASTATVGDDFRITFANANPDYPNSSAQRVFKTADFTVPYTVTDTDGNTASATLTVTVAGKPVSPPVSSWILNDPSTGTKAIKTLTQLDLRTYPQTIASSKSVVPGHGVTVTGLVAGEHASAVPVAGGIELRAEPRDYVGNDVVTLQLTDTWGRTVEHKAGVSWVDRTDVTTLRTKVGVGQSAHVDLQQVVADGSLANFPGGAFTSTRDVWNGTITTGAHAQDVVVTPKAGFVGTSTDSAGTRFTWAYRLTNPWQPAGWTGPATDAKTNTVYVDVQAPPQAADVVASTTAGRAADVDVRTPATLPWSASTMQLRDAPGHGTATVTGDGQVRYTPDAGFPAADALAATDSFTFVWTDDLGQESEARATVTVRNGPALADHAVTTPTGVAVSVDLLTGAFGDGVAITGVGPALEGVADLSGATAVYSPQDGFVGEDAFAYQGVDAHGQPAEGTVRIQVLAAPAVVDPAVVDPDPTPETDPTPTSEPAPAGSPAVAPEVSEVLSAPGGLSDEEDGTLASTGLPAAALLGAAALLVGAGAAGVLVRSRGRSV
jgi:hypothetical protein